MRKRSNRLDLLSEAILDLLVSNVNSNGMSARKSLSVPYFAE
jgi:hypothetical protein